MRILATLLQPTWGEASVCGYSIYTQPKEIRRLIGYMPDFFGVYDDMKVIEYLEFFAAAYRIKGPARRKICNEVLDLVDLGYKRDALRHEPFARHDAAARPGPRAAARSQGAAAGRAGQRPRPAGADRNPQRCLKELRKMGKTIMVSSHILPELADICNKVGIIERGELLVNGNVADVMKLVRQRTRVEHRRGRRSRAGRASCLEQSTLVEKRRSQRRPASRVTLARERRPTTATCRRC